MDAKVFFHKYAGWSYDPNTETPEQGRERCAVKLAEAEAEAIERNWSVEIVADDEPCMGCDCKQSECACSSGTPHTTVGAILKDADGNVLESLWGICEPTNEYLRVVSAELALEAI